MFSQHIGHVHLSLPSQNPLHDVLLHLSVKLALIPMNKSLTIDVAFDEEMTETYGKDLNVFEEIAGNFGRFPANSGRQDR